MRRFSTILVTGVMTAALFLVSGGAAGEARGFPMDPAQIGTSADGMARHFIEEMIPHHEDAVTMADLALVQAEHPELRELAGVMKQVQTEEIALMRAWYQEWFGAEHGPAVMGGMMHPGMSGSMGPGMGHGMDGEMGNHEASAIDGAVPFDKAFIEAMIPHHQMAVMMATMALGRANRPELRELIQGIIVSQNAEIDQMRIWHRVWYGTL